MTIVRRLTADDWELLARVRLAALTESPEAFYSTLQLEQGLDESEWRERAASAAWFAAGAEAEEPDGLCAVLLGGELPEGEAHVISMWVAPSLRGSGLAGRLLDAASAYAVAEGARRLSLWVKRDNARALRAYARQGFGEAEPPSVITDYRCEGELYLVRPLAAGS